MTLLTHGEGLLPPAGLIHADTLIDIGPGIRPCGWYTPELHLCVEPHERYVEALRAGGYTTVHMGALEYLEGSDVSGCAVYLLDVIEHMEKEEGRAVVSRLESSGAAQVIIFTPHGFMPQEGDAWNMGGEYWQKHRSGWLPEDFPGWRIQEWTQGHAAFFAIKE